jgi:hypothetical protein
MRDDKRESFTEAVLSIRETIAASSKASIEEAPRRFEPFQVKS